MSDSIVTLWTSGATLLLSNLSHDSLTKCSCALAQLAWNAFAPRPGRISYPSVHTSSTSPRWSLLEDWVRAVLASAIYTSTSFRLPSHGRIYTVTHAPPVAGPSSLFFFVPPVRDLRDILFIQIFCFLSSEIACRRSYSNESTTQPSYIYINRRRMQH